MHLHIVTREVARANGLKKFYLGAACKHGHESPRWVSSGNCVQCAGGRLKKEMAEKPHLQAARRRSWVKQNLAKHNAMSLAWYKAHPAKRLSLNAERQATKLKATPAWADKAAIDQYYLIATFLTAELGVDFHVDHIVPLRGEAVQGFHSQHNLSIALGAWNRAKSNKWWPHMPEPEQLALAA